MISRMNAALFAKQAELKKNEKGFTLVELLVVVLIIGILAAIAIPFFLNQRQGAWESAVESDLRNAATAAETYISTGEAFSGLNAEALEANGYNKSEEVSDPIVTLNTTAQTYTISATHSNLNDTFTYSSETGAITSAATAGD